MAPEESGQPGAIGAGALDADLVYLPEALKPGEQRLVAGRARLEGLRPEQSTERVQGGGNVDVEVGVDTTGHPTGSFYDGHGHPFLP